MDVHELVGREFGPSDWVEVTQERIDAFADATEDHQWIHVDPARAEEGPFGTTIAHGFLTLSFLPRFLYGVLDLRGHYRLTVNYGLNRVRFTAPVPVGSRLRGRVRVASVEDVAGGAQLVVEATVEREGSDRPVCVAESVYRLLD
jgi:acyl dehydratase